MFFTGVNEVVVQYIHMYIHPCAGPSFEDMVSGQIFKERAQNGPFLSI